MEMAAVRNRMVSTAIAKAIIIFILVFCWSLDSPPSTYWPTSSLARRQHNIVLRESSNAE